MRVVALMSHSHVFFSPTALHFADPFFEDGIREMMVAHASSSRFLLLELHGNHAGYGLFQPREVMVTRTNVQGSDIGVFGFVVAGATTRTSDRRRAAGVYVWHVHEPALCGQLVPGDRILQVRNNMTTLSTVRDVHRLLQQGPSEMLLTVRNDPVGYSALKAEIGETGSSADGLLSQRLLDSGLALEAPTPESLAMHPGASTPVASAHFGAARASTCARRERPAEHQARTVIERMQKRVLSEQTANMKVRMCVVVSFFSASKLFSTLILCRLTYCQHLLKSPTWAHITDE